MSIEAMAIVLNHSRAKGAAKLVLLGIANHINPDNDGAWPSQAKLAGYANVSDRAVRDAVDQLVDLGELRYQVAGGQSTSQYKPNRYWLLLTCPLECDGTANHRTRVEVSGVQGGSFLQSGWKPASDEPLIEPLIEPIMLKTEFEQQFDLFWKPYPRKVAKQPAIRALRKALKVTDFDTILNGVHRFAADPNKYETTYLPYPATWLNECRWNDAPYPPRPRTADEQAEEEKIQAQLRRATAKRHSEELRRESEEARKRMAPPPTCEHGVSIIRCRKCLLGLN